MTDFYTILAKELCKRFEDAYHNNYDPELMITSFLKEALGPIKYNALEFDTVSDAINFYAIARQLGAMALLKGKTVFTNISPKRAKKLIEKFD